MTSTNKGNIDTLSHHTVEPTVERLKNNRQSKGVMLFALVDHSREAEKVIAIDLPLKILVRRARHGLPRRLLKNIAVVATLAANAVE